VTPPTHLQAIVFDFDGVIANSEPLHLQAFQQTLSEEGIALTPVVTPPSSIPAPTGLTAKSSSATSEA